MKWLPNSARHGPHEGEGGWEKTGREEKEWGRGEREKRNPDLSFHNLFATENCFKIAKTCL